MSSLSFSVNPGYMPWFNPSLLTTTTTTGHIHVKVYPLFYNKVIVEWRIPARLGVCTFNVYKSPSDAGPWSKINDVPLSNTNFLADTTTEDFSIFKKSYYTVEVRLPSPDGRYIKSCSTTWENRRGTLQELRAREVTRREKILLNKFVGIDSLVFRRKYFGERCPQCWNPVIEKVTQDHCPTCYGTSFLGGYFPGVPTKICYDPSPNSTQLAYLGKLEINQLSAWTIEYPSVDSLDLIVRIPDFKTFRVSSINQTELQTVKIRQIMALTELSKGSVECTLIDQIMDSKYINPNLLGSTTKTSTGYII